MKPNFRMVDNERSHARLPAREQVAEFRLDREKGEKPLGLATRTSGSGAPLLDVNAVLKRTLPGSLGKR